MVLTTMPSHAEENTAVERSASNESTIMQKHSNQKIGPHVDPWPGPKSGTKDNTRQGAYLQ